MNIALQEELLTLLCFDDKNAVYIQNAVPVDYFEESYRNLASHLYTYIQDHQKAPGAHTDQLLIEAVDQGLDASFAQDFIEQSKSLLQHINTRFTITKTNAYVRQQALKTGILQAATFIQGATEEADLDKVETILREATKIRNGVFEEGTRLDTSYNSLTQETKDALPTGIKELDAINFGPSLQELLLFIGPYGKGKSWWLTTLGKQALKLNKKVLHITLEMPENQMAVRYAQSIFALPEKTASVLVRSFSRNQMGALDGIDEKTLQKDGIFDLVSQKDKTFLNKWERWRRRLKNIYIKQFPTGSLTIPQLKNYMELLYQNEGFSPQLLIVDYPDIMTVDPNNLRTSIGSIIIQLRGIAMEKNIAVAVVSQSNREGVKRGTTRGTDSAEDFSKTFTADKIITYSQTEEEEGFSLARLHVDKYRAGRGNLSLAITQAYGIGQFCTASHPLDNDMKTLLEDLLE